LYYLCTTNGFFFQDIEFLKRAGLNVNHVFENGRTCLHLLALYRVQNNEEINEICFAIHELGAKCQKDDFGKYPFEYTLCEPIRTLLRSNQLDDNDD